MSDKPTVELVGKDGNAFAIMARVNNALRAVGLKEEAGKYMKEAVGGDYGNLLRVSMKYVNVK